MPGSPASPDQADEAASFGRDLRPPHRPERALGDFTTTGRVLTLVPLALCIGALAAGISLALLDMIGLITNALYYGRLSTQLVSPNANTLGWVSVVIPIGGGILVGLMARYGSEQIRGHGIPEAMERILLNGSRVAPRLAILKPVSSAIAIGTGGPFGAEGPIILTGGAVGSIVGQLFRLTAAERRALLVAGAAAGMSAVFGTPVAAALFGIELLVFELRPRSMVLIAFASATADGLRMVLAHAGLVAPQPLFPIPSHAALGGVALISAALIGLVTGFAAWVMTQAVYGFEDLFTRLGGRVHWMWWPMFGGVVIGIGGVIDPRALGVGYNEIHAELLNQLGITALITLFVVKLVIWSCGLGSGTSGGILAPILMMGGALGALLGHVLPGASAGVFAEIGLAGALSAATGSPFTAMIFALELTHDANSLVALLIAASVAHLVGVLTLKRSVLTEKVARRGFHIMREYAVDPLEATFVREVMDTDVLTTEPERTVGELYAALPEGSAARRQRLYPVLAHDGRLIGLLPFSTVLAARATPARPVSALMQAPIAVTHADEILRRAADRMVESGLGVLPVVARDDPTRLEGLVSSFALLSAREKLLVEERRAERVLTLRRVPARRPSLVARCAPGSGTGGTLVGGDTAGAPAGSD